jgi:phosphatidylserine decarboxylase
MSAFVQLQKLLPQHALSRLLGRFANSPLLCRPLIHAFSAAYGVSLAEAQRRTIDEYRTFNDFFTRSLAPGARPLPEDRSALVSPADGEVSQLGAIADGALLQAKGMRYSLTSLLLDSRAETTYDGGWFATIYLAPSDYHRVHVPLDGTLVRSVAVPGELFSVNAKTEAGIARLFCRNERLVMHFDSAIGPFVLVMVGALIVASIETVFDAPQSPYLREVTLAHDRSFTRGDEIGRFLVGSTVIVIVPRDAFVPATRLAVGTRVKMGEALGSVTPAQYRTA